MSINKENVNAVIGIGLCHLDRPFRYNRPFYSTVLSYLAMNASEAGVELALI